MRPRRWWYTAAPALAGIVCGWFLIAMTGDDVGIGATILASGLFALLYAQNKAWITDTQYEKERLRNATLTHDQSREQALAGHTMQLAERERHRTEHAEALRSATQREELAGQEVLQAQINYDQRAAAAERSERERADKRIADEIIRLRKEAAERHALNMTESYEQGVIDTMTGQIDKIVGPRNVFRLADRRPPEADGNPASGTDGRP